MRISYDGEGDTLSIVLRRGQILHAEEYGPIILNYNGKKNIVEIEIQKASRVLGDFLEALLRAKPGEKLVEVPFS